MAAGIALELHKVIRKMTLLFGFQTETDYVTFYTYLILTILRIGPCTCRVRASL